MIRRLVSTRHGFFALAAVVAWLTLLVIEPEFRWVSLATGGLYALLSLLFFVEHITRGQQLRSRRRGAGQPDPHTRSGSS